MKSSFTQKISQVIIILVITLVLVKLLDLAVPLILPTSTLFPPNQKVLYRTIEFDSVVSINQFGFRGSETSLETEQIITIGDSFTFGWGVKDVEVWSRLLENKLASTGVKKNVYNLGMPGTNTEFHINVARTYVKKLKPSIVIISVLLDDDFQQVYESKQGKRGKLIGAKKSLKAWFPGWYNLYVTFRNTAAKMNAQTDNKFPINVTSSWSSDALKIINESDLEIPDDIMALVADGQIDPGKFMLASKFPDRISSFWRNISENGSREQETFLGISRQLKELNQLVKDNGGRLILFSMPSGNYVRSRVSQNYKKYGLTLDETNFSTLVPENLLRQMAKENEFEFVPSLETFRANGKDYFFEFDGHLNPEGNTLVANILVEYLLINSSFTTSSVLQP